MKILLVKPLAHPEIVEIEKLTLEYMQKAVGGNIEAVYPFADPVAIICNEEGKLDGLPLNRDLRDEDGRIYDILAGDFLVVGVGRDNFCGLDDKLVEEYRQEFWDPKIFAQNDQSDIEVLTLAEFKGLEGSGIYEISD